MCRACRGCRALFIIGSTRARKALNKERLDRLYSLYKSPFLAPGRVLWRAAPPIGGAHAWEKVERSATASRGEAGR